MTSRKELVNQAIHFRSPSRIPVAYWNCDQTKCDVMLYHLALERPGDDELPVNDWGPPL